MRNKRWIKINIAEILVINRKLILGNFYKKSYENWWKNRRQPG